MATELKETRRKSIRKLEEFDKPLWIATHFGFMPIEPPHVKKTDIEATKDCGRHPHYDAAEKAAVIRMYMEHNLSSMDHPLAFAYKRNIPRTERTVHSLHFIGSQSGIAEALLIQSALSILSEEGHKRLVVDANCIGDKDSIASYERELINLARKALSALPEETRRRLMSNTFELFQSDIPEVSEMVATLPSSIASLSSQSRNYFKEVLEYIEALNVEFRLARELVGERHHSSHTIFAIKDASSDKEETLAVGYRYSRLAKRMGLKKEIPMVGINIFSTNSKSAVAKRVYKDSTQPKFYLIQLGREAKMRSLPLIEQLRRERIRVHHLLGRDKITAQFGAAENLPVTHHIIIGQKEALEKTATVRNVTTRAQDTIPLSQLASYLKNVRV
jgi:histidyl-tRNA synthetase